MPSQKECTALNDAMMLSRAARDARAETGAQRFAAIRRMEDREEVRQHRKLRQAAMCRVLDGVLIGLCMGAVLVMACVALTI